MRPSYLYLAVLTKIKAAQMNYLQRWNYEKKNPEWAVFPGTLNAPCPQTAALIVPGTNLSASPSVSRGAVAFPLCQTLQGHLGASTQVRIVVIKWVPSHPPSRARLPPWPEQPPHIYPETSRFCSLMLQKKPQTVYTSLWVPAQFLFRLTEGDFPDLHWLAPFFLRLDWFILILLVFSHKLFKITFDIEILSSEIVLHTVKEAFPVGGTSEDCILQYLPRYYVAWEKISSPVKGSLISTVWSWAPSRCCPGPDWCQGSSLHYRISLWPIWLHSAAKH